MYHQIYIAHWRERVHPQWHPLRDYQERVIVYRPRQHNCPQSQRTRGATNTSTRRRASASEQPTTSHVTPSLMRPQNFTHLMHSSFQLGSNSSEGLDGTSGTAGVGTRDDDDDDNDADDVPIDVTRSVTIPIDLVVHHNPI
ncbi:hypothetical protein V6N12_058911 [Hibiscus sabdariffa]|uniref:Uncharacterized protein n=1 Tax=Hibiscus sabdariffa TaxID=183260 RepID=A0ABR2ETL8_9ROSI